jgi:DNA-directed RNA polymerase subunit M/transcription elongation factor TFIIS
MEWKPSKIEHTSTGFDGQPVICPHCKSDKIFDEDTQLDSDDKTFLTEFRCAKCFGHWVTRYLPPDKTI